MGRRSRGQEPDWHAIERDYRAGVYPSVRALARAHVVSHTAISKRAEAGSWTQAATDLKRERVKDAMMFPPGTVNADVETLLQEAVKQDASDQNLAVGNARRILVRIGTMLDVSAIPGTLDAAQVVLQARKDKEAFGEVPADLRLILGPRDLRTLGSANLIAIQTIRDVRGLDEKGSQTELPKEHRDAILAAAQDPDA